MRTDSIRFIIPDAHARGPGSNLTIVTTCNHTTVFDPNAYWQTAIGATGPMETAMAQALNHRGTYPDLQGQAMLTATDWINGLNLLLDSLPDAVKLNLDYDTCKLLPELFPTSLEFRQQYPGQNWLDCVAPIYRTLNIGQRPVTRFETSSIAIICQDGNGGILVTPDYTFEAMADTISSYLPPAMPVDIYLGSEFTHNPRDRSRLLQKIFHWHRAVVFMCHSNRSPHAAGGWQLTDDTHLSVSELRAFLGDRHNTLGPPIPEIIFSIACSGAAIDPMSRILYPEMFLNAGVNFFVGAWMDVVLRSASPRHSLDLLISLVTEFLLHWIQEPENAIYHLYAAKRQCQFDLLTSLFQIYTCAGEQGGEAAAREREMPVEKSAPHQDTASIGAVETAEPVLATPSEIEVPILVVPVTRIPIGAMISSLEAGSEIGHYQLLAELWTDPHSRTFFAVDEEKGTRCLVQVLADEWQNRVVFRGDIARSISRLHEMKLKKGHLIPHRHEIVSTGHIDLDILVYERPNEEQPEGWRTLHAQNLDVIGADHFVNVMRWGARIGYLLAELHSHNLSHGNFDPGAVVFLNNGGNEPEVFIKDSWVHQVRPARMTNPRYAAPEEPKAQEGLDQRKYDCFGLGRILYEMAHGKPYDGSSVDHVRKLNAAYAPEALTRVIGWCINPSAKVRPGAEGIARRLDVAASAGGTYLDTFAEQFDLTVQAGQRLFAVQVDDMDELVTSLKRLTQIPAERRVHLPQYALFVLQEGVGLQSMQPSKIVIPWTDRVTLATALKQDPQSLSYDFVVAYNIENVIDSLTMRQFYAGGRIPVIVMQPGALHSAAMGRSLKFVQGASPAAPVIVLADSLIFMDPDLQRVFAVSFFPPLSAAELYDQVMAFAETELSDDAPLISDETAVELAVRLFPCSRRDAIMILRMCALKYGVIDDRAIDMRDDARKKYFYQRPGTAYLRPSELPPNEWFALPGYMVMETLAWMDSWERYSAGMTRIAPPCRLLVSGAGGTGKTSLVYYLASHLRLPIVRIDPNHMLQGQYGQSENNLRVALNLSRMLYQCLVVLDNMDAFLRVDNLNDGSQAQRLRMTTILLDYLDGLPSGIAVVLVSQSPHTLPAQWRRRWENNWEMPEPYGDGSLEYRAEVFAAIFRRFNLAEIANQTDLMTALAQRTDPTLALVLNPLARRTGGQQTIELRTGADIEHWIRETLILHASATNDPTTPAFWYAAL